MWVQVQAQIYEEDNTDFISFHIFTGFISMNGTNHGTIWNHATNIYQPWCPSFKSLINIDQLAVPRMKFIVSLSDPNINFLCLDHGVESRGKDAQEQWMIPLCWLFQLEQQSL